MLEYFLHRHVHFCCRGEALVFLDLERDDYLLVSGEAAATLKALSEARPHELPIQSESSLQELLAGGILTTDSSAGRQIVPASMELAMQRLIDPEASPTVHITATHIWRFAMACTSAAIQLRWWRLERIVGAVARRKLRWTCASPMDMTRAVELTAIFQRLRYFFPANYVCLYDSLALIKFLAAYRLFPAWVFGVMLEPWAAHCWVQHAEFTFNEGVEEVTNYTPIMVV